MQSSPIYVHSSPSRPSSPIYIHSSPIRAIHKLEGTATVLRPTQKQNTGELSADAAQHLRKSLHRQIQKDSEHKTPCAPSPTNDCLPPYTLPPGPYNRESPNHSLPDIVGQAIMSSRGRCLTLSDIWNWISTVYPYFRLAKKRWRPLIHSVLQRNEIFQCLGKDSGEDPKHWRWTIREKDFALYKDGGFRCEENPLKSKVMSLGTKRSGKENIDAIRVNKKSRHHYQATAAGTASHHFRSSVSSFAEVNGHPYSPPASSSPVLLSSPSPFILSHTMLPSSTSTLSAHEHANTHFPFTQTALSQSSRTERDGNVLMNGTPELEHAHKESPGAIRTFYLPSTSTTHRDITAAYSRGGSNLLQSHIVGPPQASTSISSVKYHNSNDGRMRTFLYSHPIPRDVHSQAGSARLSTAHRALQDQRPSVTSSMTPQPARPLTGPASEWVSLDKVSRSSHKPVSSQAGPSGSHIPLKFNSLEPKYIPWSEQQAGASSLPMQFGNLTSSVSRPSYNFPSTLSHVPQKVAPHHSSYRHHMSASAHESGPLTRPSLPSFETFPPETGRPSSPSLKSLKDEEQRNLDRKFLQAPAIYKVSEDGHRRTSSWSDLPIPTAKPQNRWADGPFSRTGQIRWG